MLKNEISIQKFCPQSILKPSVVHFQGIAMKFWKIWMRFKGRRWRNSFLNSPKKWLYKMSCAICPLNPIQTPESFFRWIQKWIAPSTSLKSYTNLSTFQCLILANEWELRHPCPWKWPIFCNFLHSGNLPLCLALENGPHQVPRKRIFSWVCQRKLDTWWGPFSGANPSGKLALRWFPPIFFLNIKLPFWA